LHTEVQVTAKTVGFAISEENRPLLDELVDYFADGNRSEFLRIAMERMAREKFANRMTDLQSRVRAELGGRVLSEDEVAALVREVKAKN
jgi:hypothetical protein